MLKIPMTDSVSDLGIKTIFYRISLQNYPSVVVDSYHATIEVKNPCDPIVSFQMDPSSAALEFDYIVGTEYTFSVPEFTFDPVICSDKATYSLSLDSSFPNGISFSSVDRVGSLQSSYVS